MKKINRKFLVKYSWEWSAVMYTLCISDKNNDKRRENATSELNKIGLPFEFFDAVMGKNMSKDELDAASFPNTHLTSGEIGCALSHVGCYKKFLSTEEKSLMVFEDDILFFEGCSKDLLEKLVNFVEGKTAPAVLGIHTDNYDFKRECVISRDIQINKAYGLYGTYAYIVNRPAAEKLIEIQTPATFESDLFKFFYFLSGIEIFTLNRNVLGTHPEDVLPSNLTPDRYRTGNRMKRKKKAFWTKFLEAPLNTKMGILWRRVYKHYLSDVKRKRFLKEIQKSEGQEMMQVDKSVLKSRRA